MSLYQVALIGPRLQTHSATIQATVNARARDLGLAPRTALRFFRGDAIRNIDRRYPVVGVYFGGAPPRPSDTRHAEALVATANLVIPVVPKVDDYHVHVPRCLSGVNGLVVDPRDRDLEVVARRINEGLDLLRARRLVFISYRRQEGAALAEQLHQAFDARCWQSFLDTHTVDSAADFQPILWDRMNDADVLVLLDSPNALASRWVAKEIEAANQLGMGVLQLIWPDHVRDPRTRFATPVYLRREDFLRGRPDRVGGLRLKKRALSRAILEAERLRARSVAARRDRLVRTFAVDARAAGLTPKMQAVDEIEVVGSKGTHRVYPVSGHVDSVVAHHRAIRAGSDRAHLLYDPTGLLQQRIEHINWLSDHLPVGNLSSLDVAAWAADA